MLVCGSTGCLAWIMLARRRRDRAAALRLEVAELRWALKLVREDLSVMGARLDDTAVSSDPDASAAWKRAVAVYAGARNGLREASSVDDVRAVQSQLREGWFHLAASDALALGLEPPSGAETCHFNPQHGPAVTECLWAPAGRTPEPVPVCRIDAARIEEGLAPMFRQVRIGTLTAPFHELGRLTEQELLALVMSRSEPVEDTHADLLAQNFGHASTSGDFLATRRRSPRGQ